jgi:TonB dependent receptor/Carboxypeptidase regulatory-like domain/TonB-dependent Receptor Plug Domain
MKHLIRNVLAAFTVTACLLPVTALATIFGSVRGIVHDPQHRPVQGAMVMLRARTSDWSKTTETNAEGQFSLNAVPIGDYAISVASPGFTQTEQTIEIASGSAPVVHFQLRVASAKETVDVAENLEVVPTSSATPTTLVSRLDIERTPGASHSNSMAMITNYVPGAYVTHDQLHIRGGHQTSWLVDGVPVPNTNIASNIAPQFDPKDIDYMEVNRGSYGAEFGDRTYGVFNIVPRSGFERNNQAELVLGAGNFNQTNDQLSFGSHTGRFAYYGSVNGNRSDLGLQTPVSKVVHDAVNGYGGFGSLIFNVDPSDQLRLVTSARRDYYQIPYDPFPNDIENANIAANGFVAQYPSFGIRDGNHESDALANFSWVHTFNSRMLLTVSPFYHRNTANYDGSPADDPIATTDHHTSTYAGGQVSFSASLAKNDLQAGFYGFHQNDRQLFGIISNDNTNTSPFAENDASSGSLTSFFLDDKFKPFSWLALTAGMRPTHFSGSSSENAISPRFGAALHIPRLNWTFRAFYGHYYQAAPLLTVGGPFKELCATSSCAFLPLTGERDEEHQFGVTIPYRGWVLDADNFKTSAHNFFDHGCIGSGLCLPLTIERAAIQGWELTLRSPRIAHRGQIHLAYSNQAALGGGAINGGFTDGTTNLCDPNPGLCPLDHDQTNTVNLGGNLTLPWRAFASTNVYYGSGFTNAFVGAPFPERHLPGHTTFDLSLGKDFGENLSASVNALNVTNRRVELDNSQTFGGFHWNNPRELSVELRYRFHY